MVLLQNLQCMEPMQSSKDLHSPNFELLHSVAVPGGLGLLGIDYGQRLWTRG